MVLCDKLVLLPGKNRRYSARIIRREDNRVLVAWESKKRKPCWVDESAISERKIPETKKQLAELFCKNDRVLYRAIVFIFNRQTIDEKSKEETEEHNEIGLNGTDARFISQLAKTIMRGNALSRTQLEMSKYLLIKYHEQLMSSTKEEKAKVNAFLKQARRNYRCSYR